MQKSCFKTFRIEDIVETVLDRMGECKTNYISCDYAKGNDLD